MLAVSSGCTLQQQSAPDQKEANDQTSQSLLGICAPLTCCFPSGGKWSEQDPFERSLKALGCSKPQAYTQSYGQSEWWLYSSCPASLQLTELVLQYATVSPYYSQLVVNECLELQALGSLDPTSVFVQWDPTCSSCYWAAQ
jgi:hypothetical protein